jgi:hypothetical protein
MAKESPKSKPSTKGKISTHQVVGDKVKGHVPRMQNPPTPPPKKNK